MKSATMKRQTYLPCPNAATRQQQLHKFIDKCLVAASAIGIVAMLMLLAVIV